MAPMGSVQSIALITSNVPMTIPLQIWLCQ